MNPDQVNANKELVRRLFEEVFNDGQVQAISSLVRDDYVQHNPMVGAGADGLEAFVTELRRVFPDLHFTIEDLVAERDRVVARVSVTGTHSGEFIGIPATGRFVHTQSIDIFRIAGDRLAEHWDVLDLDGLRRQLGAPGHPLHASNARG